MSNDNLFLSIWIGSACFITLLVIIFFRVAVKIILRLLGTVFPPVRKWQENIKDQAQAINQQKADEKQKEKERARIKNSHKVAPRKIINCYDTNIHTTRNNPSFINEVYLVGQWINTESSDDSYYGSYQTDASGNSEGPVGYFPATRLTNVYEFDTRARVYIHICDDCLHNSGSNKAAVTKVMNIYDNTNRSFNLKEFISEMLFDIGRVSAGTHLQRIFFYVFIPLLMFIGISLFFLPKMVQQGIAIVSMSPLFRAAQYLAIPILCVFVLIFSGILIILWMTQRKRTVFDNLAKSILNIVYPGAEVITFKSPRKRIEITTP
jgi:hypothetical protein